MEFKEVMKTIDEYLSSNELPYQIIGNKHMFEETYKIILEHINNLENNEEVKEYSNKKIFDSINITLEIVIDYPLNNQLSNFLLAWSELLFNWNENVEKNNELHEKCKTLNRFLQQHFTIVEAIQVLRRLNQKNEQLRSWMPPSFELSQHYLKKLD